MKCPKCSYVSFDYNLTCPKCDKDISSEQEKLHLPAFRPDPPFMLGALTGEVNDTHGASARGSSEIHMDREAEVSFDDEAAHFDSGEVSLQESGDFELGSEEITLDDTSGLSLDSGKASARGKSAAEDVLGTDLDLDTEDAIAELDLGSPGDDELGPDTGELELGKSAGPASSDDELSLDLGEAPEDKGTLDLGSLDLEGGPEDKRTLDLGSLDLEGSADEVPAGAELGASDLQLDGESTEELDKLLDLDEIKLDEIPLEAKQGSGKGKGKKADKAQESDLSLDLGELDLELDLEDNEAH
jgi:hypothetical protein